MTASKAPVDYDTTLLSDDDLHLFNEGTHARLYEHLGAHTMAGNGGPGSTYFAVWAPGASSVTVIGDFNGWDANAHPLRPRASSGIWEGMIAGIGAGSLYKYHVVSRDGTHAQDKADPFAFAAELPPHTASVVTGLEHDWSDDAWMSGRSVRIEHDAPISIYEAHLGSWRRPPGGAGHLGYRELAPMLAEYARDMGFTHVELMPVMEHPFYGSWGYQCTGYFAPTRRYGSPTDLMYLIDVLHQHDIGVILDWVPSHFPTDAHGLGYFDGTHLYEHADPRQGFHPDWQSFIFNYGRNEVRSFLTSSALFWLDRYHADGLRLDAVASMLYLDYSREEGEWVPNRLGGRENLAAIDFLRSLNEVIYGSYPDVQTFAEESTAWPGVSRPVYLGGLGFGYKWDMGWMHDTLRYFAEDPVHRKYHHDKLTFRMLYAWTENYVLPLSHDEVVYGKRSLASKMPGDTWQQLANLRLLLGYMFAQPGKKLLFMGAELAQWREWDHDGGLDWDLLDNAGNAGVQRLVRDLNHAYRDHPALFVADHRPEGFDWVDTHDADAGVISFLRRADGASPLLVVCNFTPVPRHGYRIGVPRGGRWQEVINSDADVYGGSGMGNLGSLDSEHVASHGHPQSLSLTLPPLAIVYLQHAV
ncbi:MAG: 1,4-alpha-glucan branching protein GlgB [Acidobacteriota bacterium]|jgi:1,4-alpha-glucan branching enzyme